MPRRFTEEDTFFLRGVANVLASAIGRREAQRELARGRAALRAVFEGAGDAMLVLDDDRGFVEANPAACALLGRSRQELLGLRADDVLVPDTAPSLEVSWRQLLADGTVEGEAALRRGDGTVRVVRHRSLASVVPGRHLTIVTDVTG